MGSKPLPLWSGEVPDEVGLGGEKFGLAVHPVGGGVQISELSLLYYMGMSHISKLFYCVKVLSQHTKPKYKKV